MSSRQLQALMTLVVVAGVAIIIGIESPAIGVAILVIGALGIGVLVQRWAEEDQAEPKPRRRKASTEDDDDDDDVDGGDTTEGLEDLTGDGGPLTSRSRSSEPLQPWTPPEPLQTWTPATSRSIEPTTPPAEPTTPWGRADAPTPPPAPAPEPTVEPAAPAWDSPAANPLDELDRLGEGDAIADDVDIIAEVERLDSFGAASTIEPPMAGSPIQEEQVKTSDDILAASDATQITIGAGGNTELAKLLAKVQERLAAYE